MCSPCAPTTKNEIGRTCDHVLPCADSVCILPPRPPTFPLDRIDHNLPDLIGLEECGEKIHWPLGFNIQVAREYIANYEYAIRFGALFCLGPNPPQNTQAESTPLVNSVSVEMHTPWECPHCTMPNDEHALICVCCTLPKPALPHDVSIAISAPTTNSHISVVDDDTNQTSACSSAPQPCVISEADQNLLPSVSVPILSALDDPDVEFRDQSDEDY